MKTVFMGTPDFAVETLKALHENGHDIKLVVTQPDKPVGRSGKLSPPPVKQEGLALGLEVAQPEKASDPDFTKRIKDIAPDVIVVVAYGQILKRISRHTKIRMRECSCFPAPKVQGSGAYPVVGNKR